jgi:hypothetical protein
MHSISLNTNDEIEVRTLYIARKFSGIFDPSVGILVG